MTDLLDEEQLRKAWFKRKFTSWEYHEELLKLHAEYLTALHRHWADEQRQKRYPDFYKTMVSPVFFNFDNVPKPGETPKTQWKAGKTVGWVDAISYNFSRGLGDIGPPFDQYVEMPQEQRDRLNKLVGLMLSHCENIKYTVESSYVNRRTGSDDKILDEEITGPIDWPSNWRDDVADLGMSGQQVLRCEAGQPCPREGWWFTPAKAGSRRFFTQGELMPAFRTDYGATIWQWDERQEP